MTDGRAVTGGPGVAAAGARAVAVGTNQGVISTGDGAVIDSRTINLPATAVRGPGEVRAADGLNNLPAPHSPVFVGRHADMARLRSAMGGGPPTPPTVVHGLGGTGKSTLALHFAHRHREHYNPVWWVPADTPSGVTSAFAALAGRLHPGGDLAFATSAEAAAWAVGWLQAHQGWLLVFDNAESPHDLAPVIGPLTNGRHLVTSRRSTGWHRFARPLALDTLPSDAAVDMLARIIEPGAGSGRNAGRDEAGQVAGDAAGQDAGDRHQLERLAAELGHLPLALEQAAAYIQYTALAPAAYLERLRRHPARMFAASAPSGGPGEADNQRTVARIWQMSLHAITAEQPLAGDILRTFAWFSSDEVPRDLAYELHSDPFAVDEALALLHTYSMITLTPRSFSVHRLVRAVTRTPDDSDPHRAAEATAGARHRATRLLRASLPENPLFNVEGWARWRELLPHVEALTALTVLDDGGRAEDGDGGAEDGEGGARDGRGRAEDHGDDAATESADDAAHILFAASGFLQSEGHFDQAVVHGRRSVRAFTRLHGPDDPRTLAASSFLASAHRAAGDLETAALLHRRNLADCERVLGPDHLDTLAARGNLAYLYALRGDNARALELHRRNLADHERLFGADHPHTVNSRANLAGSYRSVGDLARAVALHERSVTDHERVFGPDHPETLAARSNLAYAYQLAGDPARAVPLYESVLADRERLLGPEHPHTLLARDLLHRAPRPN
ncbi:hypothetical protein GCM10009654_44780 [Streptomyces hebeiensis]|uniref:Orc1-like AAA ATPase domain-containing protein n=1 Tax=Streptomyces hebeiensis TaxID=229486 RepID=A0ABP4FKF6_9ACTN